jgi:methanogenic corrinoid protein MtbC1
VSELVAFVDAELSSRTDLDTLLGSNPFSLAHSDHDHHGRFVATVLTYGAGDLLAKALPWVYRSYHARRVSYEYFLTDILAWERAITACLPPGDAAEVLPLYRWMRDRHNATIESAEAEATGTTALDEPQGASRLFLSALLQGDHRAAGRLALEAVPGPDRLADFYIGTIQLCLRHVGTLWERGQITVAQEHLASATVGNVMAALYGRILSQGAPRGVAAVTTVSGEFHEVGGRMVADLLEVDGWDVRYLGAGTPAEDLGSLCASEGVAFAALSVTMHYNLGAAALTVDAIRRVSPRTGILVGGAAFAGNPEFWAAIGADSYASDAIQAVEAARRWGAKAD